ncbi:hypothetical protein [Roseibium sp.]|uniref:hypothetical protein n=1 Tax=Roseibium sp. TaxID=1936156 RepID=UPI003D0FD99D
MFWELIATLVAGVAAAGLVMLVNRIAGGRLPRWFAPVAAGAVMIATTIFNEYDWYARTSGALPETLVVAQTVEGRAIYRPWTYLWPIVERFAAVDMASARQHPGQPGLKLVDVYFFGRWSPASDVSVLADCPGLRRAVLAEGVSFESDGQIKGVEWVKVADGDPLVGTICGAR